INYESLAKQFNFKKGDDLLAALGRSEVSANQIINKLTPTDKTKEEQFKRTSKPKKQAPSEILVEGSSNLMTHIAKCCQPIPGEEIIGYITLGRGIAIHQQDCSNILNASERQQVRIIPVSWGEKALSHYSVDIHIEVHDRHGLLRDITSLLTHEKTYVLALKTDIDKKENLATVDLTVEINDLSSLSRLLDKIKHIKNVVDARRITSHS
ncbi:MAG: ACT domain-containing protein, partial [Gammaproteobacteria bacterium]